MMKKEMKDTKKIIILMGIILILGIIFGFIILIEKVQNNIKLSHVLKESEIANTIDCDYSTNLTDIYKNEFIIYDDVDRFIASNNRSLSQYEILQIKQTVRQNTSSDEQYYIMLSLYSVESNFHKNANSFLGAEYGRGLGQVSEVALEEYNRKNKTNIKPNELYNIETNIKVSCWLISYFQNTYDLDMEGTLMTYNKGYNGYRKNKKDTGYSDKIMNNKIKLG